MRNAKVVVRRQVHDGCCCLVVVVKEHGTQVFTHSAVSEMTSVPLFQLFVIALSVTLGKLPVHTLLPNRHAFPLFFQVFENHGIVDSIAPVAVVVVVVVVVLLQHVCLFVLHIDFKRRHGSTRLLLVGTMMMMMMTHKNTPSSIRRRQHDGGW